MRPVFIYALCEPGTRTVRYIGKTDNLARRFKEHRATSSKEASPLGSWLRGLSAPPNLVCLCETSEAFWQDEESRYIRSARALGMPLVNSTDGGEGGSGHAHTPETRAAISAALTGLKRSPEQRAAMSAVSKGVPKSPEHRAAIGAALTGFKRSPENCAAMSASQMGKKASPEARLKMSGTRLGLKRPGASSQFRGVYWLAPSKKWRARVWVSGRLKSLGSFNRETEAALAVDAAIKLYNLPNPLNFPNL